MSNLASKGVGLAVMDASYNRTCLNFCADCVVPVTVTGAFFLVADRR